MSDQVKLSRLAEHAGEIRLAPVCRKPSRTEEEAFRGFWPGPLDLRPDGRRRDEHRIPVAIARTELPKLVRRAYGLIDTEKEILLRGLG